jgi:hypothetical protein
MNVPMSIIAKISPERAALPHRQLTSRLGWARFAEHALSRHSLASIAAPVNCAYTSGVG